MLDVRELSVTYGRHCALDGINLNVSAGEIVVILGANGAGKSSLLKAMAGLVALGPDASVTLDLIEIGGLKPHEIVEKGLALVPEGRGIFGDLTVGENLALGAYALRARASEPSRVAEVYELFPRLKERRKQTARTMSGGEQQMVAISRAIMSNPLILMLDEPSIGLSPALCGDLFKALNRIRAQGIGILLVEQNVRSLEIADRGYVLENGRMIYGGNAGQLRQDETVQRAYLGTSRQVRGT